MFEFSTEAPAVHSKKNVIAMHTECLSFCKSSTKWKNVAPPQMDALDNFTI